MQFRHTRKSWAEWGRARARIQMISAGPWGHSLRKMRTFEGITQRKLAGMVGLSVDKIARMERGVPVPDQYRADLYSALEMTHDEIELMEQHVSKK